MTLCFHGTGHVPVHNTNYRDVLRAQIRPDPEMVRRCSTAGLSYYSLLGSERRGKK